MIQLHVRIRPCAGAQDLAWLRRSVDDIHDIYAFLLQDQVGLDLEDRQRPVIAAERPTVLAGLLAQEGTPIVRMREGSVILEMSQLLDQTFGVQAPFALGLLFKKGPDIAAWPNSLRQASNSSKEEALRARQAYEQLSERSVVEVVEDRALEGRERDTDDDDEPAPDQPAPAVPTPTASSSTRRGRARTGS